jgi:hypothetical protein
MNADQEQNLLHTAKTISDHLVYAWNYVGTLRGLQHYARECPDVLNKIGHFIGTVHPAIWFELFLKLSHCSDEHRNSTGFPKFFKQLLTYLPEHSEFRFKVKAQKKRFHELDIQKRVKNWRNQVIAHYTITDNFDIFRQSNQTSLDEIELLIDELSEILHCFSVPLLRQHYAVTNLAQYAREDVDRLVAGLKKTAE